MNRKLWIGLAVVAGLSLYLGGQSDDELLAPTRQGSKGKAGTYGEADAPRQAGRARSGMTSVGTAASAAMESWVADGLTQGVTQWQARQARAPADVLASKQAQAAWGSMRPPRPPDPPYVAPPPPPPPPPPVAPRFPHAWVGRFNDEAVAQASAVKESLPIQRAVLTGPQTTWVVKTGDVIEGQWRVDQIQDRTMRLTYLPLQQQQTVAMR
jgi:hypothetical protein